MCPMLRAGVARNHRYVWAGPRVTPAARIGPPCQSRSVPRSPSALRSSRQAPHPHAQTAREQDARRFSCRSGSWQRSSCARSSCRSMAGGVTSTSTPDGCIAWPRMCHSARPIDSTCPICPRSSPSSARWRTLCPGSPPQPTPATCSSASRSSFLRSSQMEPVPSVSTCWPAVAARAVQQRRSPFSFCRRRGT